MDRGKWDDALEVLAEFDSDNEVYRLRAGAYGGKAGLSLVSMGLKFIGKDDDSEGGSSDFFSFLDSIGVSSHVMCGSTPCIQKAITEIGYVSPMGKKDYFVRAFFRLFKAAINFLNINDLTEFTEDDIVTSGLSERNKISCYVNTFQIEITGIQSDLDSAGVTSGESFFAAVDDMFINLTH